MPQTIKGHSADELRVDRQQHILVVDDNEAIARGLARILNHSGYQAATFTRGSAALDHVVGGQTPAAAVVDIHLPDISGLVLSQKLRERLGPETPIIVLSGDTSMETLNSLPHVGATYFFSKPVSGQQLLDRLKELLGPPTAQPQRETNSGVVA